MYSAQYEEMGGFSVFRHFASRRALGAYSYGGTTAIWKRPICHHQPSEPAALRLLEASEAAGSHKYVIV